jgi:phosphatidylglycerophosphate synthase
MSSAAPARTARQDSVVARLRAVYGQKAALDRRDSVVSSHVYRPLSFYVSVPFVRLGWTPNQVTLLGVIVAVGGAALLAQGTYVFALIGSALCALQTILDYVDGNIARLRGITSHLGKFIDGVADTSVHVLIAIAIGVGLFQGEDALLSQLEPEVRSWFLFLGALTALAMTMQAFLVFRLRAACYEAGLPVGSRTGEVESVQWPASGFLRLGRRLDGVLRFEAFSMLTAIVLFAAVNLLSVFLIIRFVARTAALAVEIARTTVVARRRLNTARDV